MARSVIVALKSQNGSLKAQNSELEVTTVEELQIIRELTEREGAKVKRLKSQKQNLGKEITGLKGVLEAKEEECSSQRSRIESLLKETPDNLDKK